MILGGLTIARSKANKAPVNMTIAVKERKTQPAYMSKQFLAPGGLSAGCFQVRKWHVNIIPWSLQGAGSKCSKLFLTVVIGTTLTLLGF